MPYGIEESFFIPEVKEIVRCGHDVLVVPRSASTSVINSSARGVPTLAAARPLMSWRILASALAEFVRSPIRTVRALMMVSLTSSPAIAFRNLAVFPKALWLSRLGRTWKADHIHAHWASTMATMALVAGKVSGIPWSFTAHRGDIVANNLLAKKVEHASFARFISLSGVDLARSYGAVGRSAKISVIHMGTALPPRLQNRAATEDHANLLCAAHLIPVKGHRYLLEAVHLLKQRGVSCRLAIAGIGPLLSRLQAMTKELAIDDRVRFLGHVAHDDLMQLYRDGKVGITVLPSVDQGDGLHEGIPVALIEAMAYGVPVVSTSTGGIPELLHDGAGIMVPPGYPPALADAIESLICDSELRTRLSQAAERRVAEEFSVEGVVSQLMDRIAATVNVRWGSKLTVPASECAGKQEGEAGETRGKIADVCPRVSVVIPCRNESDWIARCLNSIVGNDYPQDRLEVLVVDGMSTDATRVVVQPFLEQHPFVRLLDNPQKITPSALNIGIQAATGDIVMRIDAHYEYPTNYIRQLVHWLQRSGADNVGGIVIMDPANPTSVAQAIAVAVCHPFGVGNAYYRIGTPEPRWVDTVPFGCYRREVFEHIGLFDEDLVRNQDIEFNLRLRGAGGRILLVPDVVLHGHARDSLKKMARMYYQYGYFNPLVIRKLGGHITSRQAVTPLFAASVILTAVLAPWLTPMRVALVAILIAYSVPLLMCSFRAALKCGVRCGIWLCVAFPLLHISHGLGFLKGFLDFVVFRRDTRRIAKQMSLTR